jgi:hypothetical protein
MAAFCPPYDALVYWANARTDTIGRANLDGTAANPTFIHVASGFPNGVAVDGAHVYGTVPDKKLAAASAEDLVAEATAVRDSLGCGTS